MISVDLSKLYNAGETAKLAKLNEYVEEALMLVTPGADVIITGQAPVWLYLRIAHALHGKCRKLYYDSPVSGKVLVFDHTP